jgi:TRAP-type uncharacterized transport system substrate-binding protein
MGYGDYVPRKGPRLDRRIDFVIAGGVRLGPSTQIGAWLAQGLAKHLRKDSTFTMRAGGGNPLDLVAAGQADLCYSTSHGATVAVSTAGRESLRNLRAICALPKRDWYQFVVPHSFGVSSVDELARKKMPLRLAVPPGTSSSGMNKLQHLVLSASGIEPTDIEKWGGQLIIGESTRPHEHVRKVLADEADSVFEDGVAVNYWWRLFAERQMVILSINSAVLAVARKELGYKTAIIPKGWYYGKYPSHEVLTIDSSGFVVLVNEKMDDDLAYLLTKCAVEYKAEIEGEYNMLPVERSSVTYPLIPSEMATDTSPIALHQGAEKYYRDNGFL